MNVPSSRKRGSANSPKSSDEPNDLRDRILVAALEMFAERGFHGTSVPDIAEAAKVGVGSIYRHFESKERLVNAVFRDSKARLRDALLLDFDLGRDPRAMFADVWGRLARFSRQHPLAFQFLEMQDHAPYLDGESRALEASLLTPLLFATAEATRDAPSGVSPAALMALVWGAFVGLVKAERHGYLALTDDEIVRAGEATFAVVASALSPRKRR